MPCPAVIPTEYQREMSQQPPVVCRLRSEYQNAAVNEAVDEVADQAPQEAGQVPLPLAPYRPPVLQEELGPLPPLAPPILPPQPDLFSLRPGKSKRLPSRISRNNTNHTF